MRVAAVQFKAIKGDRDASLVRLRTLAERAAPGADLVVLPEMAATGYLFDSAAAVSTVSEMPQGPTWRALGPVAAAHKCWLVVGFPERAKERFFNSALVIDPHGELAFTYRKSLLFEADESWASPGDSGYRSFSTDAGRFGVGICMDMNDDAFISWLASDAPRALAFPTNWLDEGHQVWAYWAWRLRDAPTALVAANTWGAEGDTRFRGESAIIDGNCLLASAPLLGDTVIHAELREGNSTPAA